MRAPSDDLLIVANTRHGPGGHYRVRIVVDGPDHDHLRDPAEASAFLADHGVPVPDGLPDRATLERLASVRELVRRLARDPAATEGGPPEGSELDAVLAGIAFRLTADGIRPERTGWPGFVDGLLPALLELRDLGEALRVCGNPRCRFAFLDRSRNRSRVWCESAVCGNRVRVGRHRRKARHVADTAATAVTGR